MLCDKPHNDPLKHKSCGGYKHSKQLILIELTSDMSPLVLDLKYFFLFGLDNP